ncbi:MAG: trypsin-like peptidase domain-containing protein [Candidatus Peregrinibacteria bacterium]
MKNTQIPKNVLVSAISGGLTALIVTLILINPSLQTKTLQSDVSSGNLSTLLDKEFISQQDLVINAVEKASPAVVSIIITKDVPILEQYYEESPSPFDNFFGGTPFSFKIPQYRDSGETEKKEIGGGSGFIVTEDGYIITNKHVVSEEDVDYTVFMSDGTEYVAEIIDRDALNDIAVLKIDEEDLPYLEFSDSDELKVGQTVIAIGNPLLQFNNSASVGVISGLSRTITAGTRFYGQAEELDDVIQTDAAINPGNSGGPLLDTSGKVIGVNVAVANAENIGFSIPSNIAKTIVDSVKENGRIVRPFLGVRYVQITEALNEKNSLDVDHGVLILRGETLEDLAVIPGSPADKAGLTENDIILEADGEELNEDTSLAKIVASKKVGDTLTLKVLHKGDEKEITVTLEEPKE